MWSVSVNVSIRVNVSVVCAVRLLTASGRAVDGSPSLYDGAEVEAVRVVPRLWMGSHGSSRSLCTQNGSGGAGGFGAKRSRARSER